MRQRFFVSGFVTAAIFAALLAGCGKSGGKTVARVGNYDITVQEFNDLTGSATRTYKSAQEEFDLKRQILDSLCHPATSCAGGLRKGDG